MDEKPGTATGTGKETYAKRTHVGDLTQQYHFDAKGQVDVNSQLP